MKIFVAIPVYDGKLQVQTVKCLLEEQILAALNGDEIQFVFLPSCSVPADGRNQLVQSFIESECEKIIFLDSDITFDMGSLLKIAHHPVDLVGGAYRYKETNENYPVSFLKDDLWSDSNGLIEVETLPTGFLAISKTVFEKIRNANPDREYNHSGYKKFCYFQMVFKDGVMHSEDSYFCKEWRESGGKVYLDPEIALVHWDFKPTPFHGHVGNWLKNRPQGEAHGNS